MILKPKPLSPYQQLLQTQASQQQSKQQLAQNLRQSNGGTTPPAATGAANSAFQVPQSGTWNIYSSAMMYRSTPYPDPRHKADLSVLMDRLFAELYQYENFYRRRHYTAGTDPIIKALKEQKD